MSMWANIVVIVGFWAAIPLVAWGLSKLFPPIDRRK